MTSRPTWSRWIPVIGISMTVIAFVIFGASVLAIWLYDRSHEATILIDDPLQSASVIVSITGAVATPGLYELPGGSRVQHVLDAAGGVRADADLAAVNPAVRVQDGEQIVIPAISQGNAAVDQAAESPTSPAEAMAISSNSPVPEDDVAETNGTTTIDINTADQEELEQLPGIGPAKAGAIIAYREEHGPFQTVEELANVEGISEEMVKDLSSYIHVGS
jgi:competence protein ComEA